jgi:hypothetical protein
MSIPPNPGLRARLLRFLLPACWVAGVLLAAPLSAEEVHLSYDSRGNVVAIEDASLAQTLRVQRFAPMYGRPGDSVTIVGTGFSTTPSSNQVTIGGVAATVTAAAADHLKVTVPNGVASGPIAVTVASVTATSTQTFTVLPATLTAAEVVTATEMTVDAPAQRVNALANRNALVAFAGQSGDLLSFQFPQLDLPAFGSASYQVFSPGGSAIASGTLTESTRTIHLPPLAASGRYALYFKSTVTLRSQVALESAALVTADGAAVTRGTTFAGQSRRLRFAGTAQQNLGFALSDRTTTPSGVGFATPVFYRPDGTTVLSTLSNLPLTGTYSFVVKPTSTATQSSFKAWLSNDLTATLSLNQLTTASVARPGQNVRYTFTGTSQQRLRLATRLPTTAPVNQAVAFYLYKPDGSCLDASCYYVSSSSDWVYTLSALPASGTYTLLVDINPYSENASTFSAPFTLSDEVPAALTLDGTATNVATTAQGQYIRATFTGTAGQNLDFAYTDLAIQPSNAYITGITYYRPNGAAITSLTNLPESGTYSILIALSHETTQASLKLWLSTQLTGSLTLNQLTTSSVSRPGQTYRYTFSGTLNQRLRLATKPPTTTPANQAIAFYLYKPDGSCLEWTCYYVSSSSDWVYALPLLPASGTYTLIVDVNPYNINGTTFSAPFALSEEVSAALTLDGSATSVATTVPGQYIRATFTGTAGQNLDFAYTGLSLQPPTAYISGITYYRPNGAAIPSLTNLPESGTYSILIALSHETTQASLNLWLSSATAGTLTAGSAATVAVSRPGQSARYTYAGTSGKQLRLTTSNTTTAAPASQRVAIYLIKPDGSYLYSGQYYNANTGTGGYVDLPTLPTTGSYTVVFDINPYDNANATFSTNVTLTVLNP